ncbi:hypothetical protein RRF57_012921 [Xylaria bambusicola]|uniref:Uncharacterized protein n=1 Tax=Xylaria bambusicola TaxID=326684 RepID=A0AAN7UYQ4_9PEZI
MMTTKKSGQTPLVLLSRFNIRSIFAEDNDRPGSFGLLVAISSMRHCKHIDLSVFDTTPVEAM